LKTTRQPGHRRHPEALERFDETMRDLALRRYGDFERELARC